MVLLVGWSLQERCLTLLKSLVYVPSSCLSICLVIDQVSEPYKRIGSMAVLKTFTLIFGSRREEDQILWSLLHAVQASALRILKSLSEDEIYDPKYLESSTFFKEKPETVLTEL